MQSLQKYNDSFSIYSSRFPTCCTCQQCAAAYQMVVKSEDRTRDAMHQTQNTKVIPMCIVIGGMDTEGEMFDDTLVMVLDEI